MVNQILRLYPRGSLPFYDHSQLAISQMTRDHLVNEPCSFIHDIFMEYGVIIRTRGIQMEIHFVYIVINISFRLYSFCVFYAVCRFLSFRTFFSIATYWSPVYLLFDD